MFNVIKLTDTLGDIVYVNPDNIITLVPAEFKNDYMKHSTVISFGKDLNIYVRESIEQIITLANEK